MKKNRQLFLSPYFLLFVFFSFLFFIHCFTKFGGDDTSYFSLMLDTYSLFSFLKMRYLSWSSRIIIEGFLVVLSRHLYLWRILDSFIYTLLIYASNRLFFKKISFKNLLLTGLVLLLYPFLLVGETGYCATSLNYLWPLALMMVGFLPYRFYLYHERIPRYLYPISVLSILYAINHEQAVCIVFAVSIFFLIYAFIQKSSKRYPILLVLLSTISLIFILTCPGNSNRMGIELAHYYPDYINANIMDKIYLGMVSSTSILLDCTWIIYFFSFILFLSIIRNVEKKLPRVISFIYFGMLTFIFLLKVYCEIKNYQYGLFNYFTQVGHVFVFSRANICWLLLIGFLFCTMIYLFYQLDKKKCIIPIFILLLGCGSRLMMGFSPTVFASGKRTVIFLFFSFLFLSILLIKRYFSSFKKIDKRCLMFLLFAFFLLNLGIFFFRI